MMQALRRYYRGATLAAMEEVQTGRRLNYHFDHQGTVQCLTDDTGAVTDRFASDAWGVPVKRTGTSINRQWYVGNLGYYRQVDQALDYVRARYYAPSHALWLSVDPIAFPPTYGYVEGRPVTLTDPSGLTPRCRLKGITIMENRPYCRQPSRDLFGGTWALAAHVFRAEATIECDKEDCQCPAPPNWTFCQGVWGTSVIRSGRRDQQTRINIPQSQMCPDTFDNNRLQGRPGGWTGQCDRTTWKYAFMQGPVRTENQDVCEYRLCMRDIPGVHNCRENPKLRRLNCFINQDTTGCKCDNASNRVPFDIDLHFSTWVCADPSRRVATEEARGVRWSIHVWKGGTSTQRCAGSSATASRC